VAQFFTLGGYTYDDFTIIKLAGTAVVSEIYSRGGFDCISIISARAFWISVVIHITMVANYFVSSFRICPSLGNLTGFHVYSRKRETFDFWLTVSLYIGLTIFVMYKFYSIVYGGL